MRANARAVVEARPDGGLRYRVLRSVAPLLLRPTVDGLHLVGGSAGPLGGDDVSLDLVVEPGATLVVRTVAASVARPGLARWSGDQSLLGARPAGRIPPDGWLVGATPTAGPWSRFRVSAWVAEGASLWWLPEPGVAAGGCQHAVVNRLDLAAGARVVWRDEVVMGRHGEDPGDWSSSLSVDLAGHPLLRHCLALGPGSAAWDGPAVAGRARAVGSILVVDSPEELAVGANAGRGPAPVSAVATPDKGAGAGRVSVLRLPGPGLLVSAMATTALCLRHLLQGALEEVVRVGD